MNKQGTDSMNMDTIDAMMWTALIVIAVLAVYVISRWYDDTR